MKHLKWVDPSNKKDNITIKGWIVVLQIFVIFGFLFQPEISLVVKKWNDRDWTDLWKSKPI